MQIFVLAFWACWLLLAGASEAHAGPIAGVFAAIGAAISSLGIVGQLILGVALKIGATLLQKALAPKPKEPGIQAEATVGGDNPLTIIMGAFGTAGQLEYANTWGTASKTPNAFCTCVFSIGDLPMALTGLWVDDKKVTLPTMTGSPPTSMGWPVTNFRVSGVDYLWVKFYDGTQTAADSFLVSQFGGADPVWQSDHIGRGIPYVIVTARLNQKLFSGVPRYFFETSGIKLYDISKDTTAGGSGSHRWNTPSTWEVSNNPVVHAYNIIRGVYYGTEWVYGGQTTQGYQLPASNWIAGINAANQDIDLKAGGVQQRYRSGCQISVDQEPLDVIESILKGCSGRMAEIGGVYKVLIGTPGAAVYSFTDASIIITEAQSFEPFPGLETTYNGAQASYPEPAEQWGAKDAPAYLRIDLEPIDDNRRLVTGLEFPTVPYAVQVQRLLKEVIQDARRFRVHQFYLPPEAWLLEPNDVVSWTSDRNGYSNKKFLIVDIAGASNMLQLVTLKEIDPDDYSWDPETEEKEYSTGVLNGALLPPPQSMTGWQAFPATLADANGVDRRPTIEVRFDGDLDDVDLVQIQTRLYGETLLNFDAMIPYGDPDENPDPKSVILNGTFLPNQDYEVRGKFVALSGRETFWSDWIGVTTPDVRFGPDDFYPIDVGDLLDDLEEWQAWIGNSVRDVLERMEELDANSASSALAAYSDVQQLRTDVASENENTRASFTEQITVATGPDSALAQQITVLNASVGGKADITALQSIGVVATNVNGQISGLGTAITGIQAQINGVSANATFRAQAGYTPGAGYTARIGLEARINSSATYRAAGLYIDATSTTARIVLSADQIAILAGGTIAALFDAGTTYIQTARIRNLTAGNIEAKSLDANAVLQNGSLITDLLAFSAVTSKATFSGSVTTGAASFTTFASAAIANPNPNPVLIDASISAGVTLQGAGASATMAVRLINVTNGTVLLSATATSTSSGQAASASNVRFLLDTSPASAGTYTYALQRMTTGLSSTRSASGSIKMLWWKR